MRRCWVVRHEDGEVEIFQNKPFKIPAGGYWADISDYRSIYVPEGFLPFGIEPKWEDEEPTEIEITIKLAEKEDEKV